MTYNSVLESSKGEGVEERWMKTNEIIKRNVCSPVVNKIF